MGVWADRRRERESVGRQKKKERECGQTEGERGSVGRQKERERKCG